MLVLLEPERPQQRKEEVKASSDISAQAQVDDSQPDKTSARVNHRLCHFAWVLGHNTSFGQSFAKAFCPHV